jgi:hypothetical protein
MQVKMANLKQYWATRLIGYYSKLDEELRL